MKYRPDLPYTYAEPASLQVILEEQEQTVSYPPTHANNFSGIMQNFSIDSGKEGLNCQSEIESRYLHGTQDGGNRLPKEMANVSSIEVASPGHINNLLTSPVLSIKRVHEEVASPHMLSQGTNPDGKKGSISFGENEMSTSINTYLKTKELDHAAN